MRPTGPVTPDDGGSASRPDASRVAPPGVRVGRGDAETRAARVRFRRVMALMVMTVVAPGSAQLVAGDRRIGRIALRIWIGLWAAAALTVLVGLFFHGFVFWLVTSLSALAVVWIVLVALAIGWAALLVDAWRLGEPMSLVRRQRATTVAINGAICFTLVGALLFGAHMVGVHRSVIAATFGDGPAVEASGGRYNVLLMGGDSGEDRWGMRPDALTLASIDEDTGDTVLISLPRNMARFPFAPGSPMAEEFPDGFDCEGCYLNGVNTWAQDHPALFGESGQPDADRMKEIGIEATVSAVEGITDLDVNYWALVDMKGFSTLVDAVGGVEVNVRTELPIGGVGGPITGYLKPGVQTLSGYQALWFARSRADSDDYSRMARQKCVMSAMVQQLDPATLFTRYTDIARAGSDMLSTSIPRNEVDTFIDLALKAKNQSMSTVSLVPPAINTGNPDMERVHSMVERAIAKSEGRKPSGGSTAGSSASSGSTASSGGPTSDGSASGGSTSGSSGGSSGSDGPSESTTQEMTGGSIGSLRNGYAANDTENLDEVC